MIVEAFIYAITATFDFFVLNLPSVPVPSWVSSGPPVMGQVVGFVWQFDAWVPMSVAGPVIVTVLACVALGIFLKVGRIVLSFFTAGGGSAG